MKVKDTNLTKHQTAPDSMTSALQLEYDADDDSDDDDDYGDGNDDIMFLLYFLAGQLAMTMKTGDVMMDVI